MIKLNQTKETIHKLASLLLATSYTGYSLSPV